MSVKTPSEILESSIAAARRKASLRQQPYRLLILSIMAGAFIALGGALSIMVGFGFPEIAADNPSIQKLLSGLAFPIGLVLTVVLGAELFTGNNAMLIPALTRKQIPPGDVAYNWIIVWLGNFAGSLLFGFLLIKCTGTLDASPYHEGICNMATTKASLPWAVTFMRGIGANWCVCLAVWLAMATSSLPGKVLACWIPVAAFVILGYEHCVANMFFLPTAMMLGADISFQALTINIVAATFGNIIGGALFVGSAHAYAHASAK